jgi:hypothetical protein
LELLNLCQQKDIGVMVIKAIAARPWGEGERKYTCWYEPFDSPDMIKKGVDFALSQPAVTGLCTTGDITILPKFLEACENYSPMNRETQEEMIQQIDQYDGVTIFD